MATVAVPSEVKAEKCNFHREDFKGVVNLDIDNQGYCLNCLLEELLFNLFYVSSC